MVTEEGVGSCAAILVIFAALTSSQWYNESGLKRRYQIVRNTWSLHIWYENRLKVPGSSLEPLVKMSFHDGRNVSPIGELNTE